MDDDWEAVNGVDPGKADSWQDANGDGVSNLEAFLDFLHRRKLTVRSEEHTSELQSLMRISYAAFCLKKIIPTAQRETTVSYNSISQSRDIIVLHTSTTQ